MMFNNLFFDWFLAGFKLDRWKKVASYPLESMAGLNRPVMYPKGWLIGSKYKFLYLQKSEIAILLFFNLSSDKISLSHGLKQILGLAWYF